MPGTGLSVRLCAAEDWLGSACCTLDRRGAVSGAAAAYLLAGGGSCARARLAVEGSARASGSSARESAMTDRDCGVTTAVFLALLTPNYPLFRLALRAADFAPCVPALADAAPSSLLGCQDRPVPPWARSSFMAGLGFCAVELWSRPERTAAPRFPSKDSWCRSRQSAATALTDPRRYFEPSVTRVSLAEREPVCLYLETTNRCNLFATPARTPSRTWNHRPI